MTVVSQFLNIDCGLSCESPYCNFNHTQFGRLNKTYELSFLNLYVQSYWEKNISVLHRESVSIRILSHSSSGHIVMIFT